MPRLYMPRLYNFFDINFIRTKIIFFISKKIRIFAKKFNKMKKILFLIISIFVLCNIGISQIVINQSDFANSTDTFLLKVKYNPTINFDLTTGSNKIWDYSNLQEDFLNFACYAPIAVLDTVLGFPFGSFPKSQFFTYGPGFLYAGSGAGPGSGAPTEQNFGYMMFFKDSSGLYNEGFYSDYGFGYRATLNTTPEMLMFAPATYQDTKINNSFWQVDINANPADVDTIYRRYVKKIFDVDAWGTLSTVLGNYNVIRVHETGYTKDSLYTTFWGITIPIMQVTADTINNYYFWAKNIGTPLLTVKYATTGNIKELYYLIGDFNINSNIITTDNKEYFFPNPAKDVIYFNSEYDVEIFDIHGKTILKKEKQTKQLNISGLKNGVYFVKFDGSYVEKLIKE